MPFATPKPPATIEEVELYACSNPACPSHRGGRSQPAVTVRWADGETERDIPCAFCYFESWVPPATKKGTKNGVEVDILVDPFAISEKKTHGVMLRCVRGAGAAVVRRNAVTYEVVEVIRSPE